MSSRLHANKIDVNFLSTIKFLFFSWTNFLSINIITTYVNTIHGMLSTKIKYIIVSWKNFPSINAITIAWQYNWLELFENCQVPSLIVEEFPSINKIIIQWKLNRPRAFHKPSSSFSYHGRVPLNKCHHESVPIKSTRSFSLIFMFLLLSWKSCVSLSDITKYFQFTWSMCFC
jgi:hypothetical protein